MTQIIFLSSSIIEKDFYILIIPQQLLPDPPYLPNQQNSSLQNKQAKTKQNTGNTHTRF